MLCLSSEPYDSSGRTSLKPLISSRLKTVFCDLNFSGAVACRMNVAVTRARRHLILVGCGRTLPKHGTWKDLIEKARKQPGGRGFISSRLMQTEWDIELVERPAQISGIESGDDDLHQTSAPRKKARTKKDRNDGAYEKDKACKTKTKAQTLPGKKRRAIDKVAAMPQYDSGSEDTGDMEVDGIGSRDEDDVGDASSLGDTEAAAFEPNAVQTVQDLENTLQELQSNKTGATAHAMDEDDSEIIQTKKRKLKVVLESSSDIECCEGDAPNKDPRNQWHVMCEVQEEHRARRTQDASNSRIWCPEIDADSEHMRPNDTAHRYDTRDLAAHEAGQDSAQRSPAYSGNGRDVHQQAMLQERDWPEDTEMDTNRGTGTLPLEDASSLYEGYLQPLPSDTDGADCGAISDPSVSEGAARHEAKAWKTQVLDVEIQRADHGAFPSCSSPADLLERPSASR